MSSDSEAPLEETGVLAHLFGVWYPKHHVVGIIEDRFSAGPCSGCAAGSMA